MPMKVQEDYSTPSRVNTKFPCHTINKTPNTQNIETILIANKEKHKVSYNGKPIRIAADFSMETLNARSPWIHILPILRDHWCQTRLLYPAEFSINKNAENKIFHEKPDLNNM